jgi:hypothetical protein
MKKNDMGRAFSTQCGKRTFMSTFRRENLKGKDDLENLFIDWKIILKLVSKKQAAKLWT